MAMDKDNYVTIRKWASYLLVSLFLSRLGYYASFNCDMNGQITDVRLELLVQRFRDYEDCHSMIYGRYMHY